MIAPCPIRYSPKRSLVTFVAQGKTRHVLVWGAVNALPATDTLNRARTALYLVVSSPQYQVQR